MNAPLTIKRLTGRHRELQRYLPHLARLRIEVFRDFPYLYQGSYDYEERYLKTYTASPESVVVLALDGDRVVGASTGIPLAHEEAELRPPFVEHGFDTEKLFYCGESVLLTDYRGRGTYPRFFTDFGRIGISVCYDGEFPAIARKQVEAGADLILVPSCTDTLAGYYRVRIGCQARALENQCYVVQSSTVGEAPWSEAVDVNIGAAAVYTPVDRGYPDDGILAIGERNRPQWVYADLDLGSLAELRRSGQVLNYRDWPGQFRCT